MKNCYIVSFQKNPNITYDGLIAAIKSYGTWVRLTETSWAIVSAKKSREIRDHLKPFIMTEDRLIVIKAGDTAAWKNFKDSTSNWLKKHIK